MAQLWLEYGKSTERTTSTTTRAMGLATKRSLKAEETVDQGPAFESLGRFRLQDKLARTVAQTVQEVQTFIKQMAALVPERQHYFILDPDETLLEILEGAESPGQLLAAWRALSTRIESAQCFMLKYRDEYTLGMNLVSPASTNRELLLEHSELGSHDDRLRQMYDRFPRHTSSLSTTDLAKLREGRNWNEIIRVPSWLEKVSPPFSPPKSQEPMLTPSTYSRTSYKAGSSFALPPISEVSETPYTPQKHVSWPDQPTVVSSYNTWPPSSSILPAPAIVDSSSAPSNKPSEQPNILLGIAAPQPISSLQSRSQVAYKTNIIPQLSSYFSRTDTWNPEKKTSAFTTGQEEAPGRSGLAWWSSVSTGGRNPESSQSRNTQEPDTRNNRESYNTDHGRTSLSNMAPEGGDDEDSVGDAFSSRPWGNWYNRRGGGQAPPPGPPDDDPGGGGGGRRPSPPSPPGNWGPPPGQHGQPAGPPGGPPGGGPPGGPGGPPGGPGGPPGGWNMGQLAGAPYGTFIPTIKAELKKEDLPSWDGNHETAIEYFWKIQQLASLGGFIPQALGYWLWTSLKEGSTVQLWFSMLSSQEQEYMRNNYLTYLYGLKEGFLGKTWQRKMHAVYENQSFRQQGHEDETPVRFIMRRTMYTRMLVNSDNGGPVEVYLVMQRAPLSWGPAINVDNIRSISQLHSKVTEHEKTLMHVSRVESSRVITADNLLYNLRRLGIGNADSSNTQNNVSRSSFRRRANLGETTDDVEAGTAKLNTADDSTEREVLQILARRQRAPPKGGYPFSKNDHVTTKMGKPPPSPCKVCGSEKHWDKECPDYDTYEVSRKRSANLSITVNPEEEDLEDNYVSAYAFLLDNRIRRQVESNEIGLERSLPQGFHEAASTALTQVLALKATRCKTEEQGKEWRATITEVDDEDNLAARAKEKAAYGVLLEEITLEPPPPGVQKGRDKDDTSDYTPTTSTAPPQPSRDRLDPPGPRTEKFRIPKSRITRTGRSAVGVSVVAMRGRVGSARNDYTDLRLDSCADITLISAEYLASLRDKPSTQQGMRMKLWQLTDKDCELGGFVRIPIIVNTREGQTIEMEAEAYVVPNMTVPILLGEDFQLTYKISVSRSTVEGTVITFRRAPYSVAAEPVSPSYDFQRLRPSAYIIGKMTRNKVHRKRKTDRRKSAQRNEAEQTIVRAKQDYTIRPNECRLIEVTGAFEVEGEWLIEKNILPSNDGDPLIVPNVLISASDPRIPVSNTSSRPKKISKGDVIAMKHDPSNYLDTPASEEERSRLEAHANAIRAIINSQLDTDSKASETGTEEAPEADHQSNESEEPYGPKTAEMPDPTIYPSEKMEELLDVGDLPPHLHDKAWAMLKSHVKAFGFDGRLGHCSGRAHIRTVDGQVPIVVPLYGSSPEKRRVIEEQLDKWLELEVIEPSISPWGAPVVIAYRNGKPRFCVDYRKLNAVTIGDEFPLPRQSEILASLSGAQVLSSLDALAGFTQLEIHEPDVEKTAFRTHRGLFQFKRMPFGLRNGPSIFQRIMRGILAPYLWLFCLVYIDDIVIYSRSYEDHIGHLDKVLSAIENSGITLSPVKCHLFYGSILLLGHKVSRLGLSTHKEKVQAIIDLARPRKLTQLQSFLGMAVYFSAFIPFYADICSPLFELLRKGTKWNWESKHEEAFESIKSSLQSAPVLGHPIEGLPYRLYTDASDMAIGCALQQIQPTKLRDLEGTRIHKSIMKAFEKGDPPPKIPVSLSDKIKDDKHEQRWAEDVGNTIIFVERVIGYWSRKFKNAELNYSATEREALAAKEGLVKFQPFIEGEKITLVTDHAALQWARTYENSNRRLASWGAIFAAYAPGLDIVHRPGRVHSNVDPLSRLHRVPPECASPVEDPVEAIQMSSPIVQKEKLVGVKFSFICYNLMDTMEREPQGFLTKRQEALEKAKAAKFEGNPQEVEGSDTEAEDDSKETDNYSKLYEEAASFPASLHTHMDPQLRQEWVKSYETSRSFRQAWEDPRSSKGTWVPGYRFVQDESGLLYFRDADYQPRLCVPEPFRSRLITIAHEHASETAHMGPEKLWQRLSGRFYWSRMRIDITTFCLSCDICQKIKSSSSGRLGFLISNPIPSYPYSSVSMDFIVNLPWSDGFNAIFVMVDRLTKHANFIPTTTGLSAIEFGALFTKRIICKFGIPESIITDRDPRWTSSFWRGVAKTLRSQMILSSSHHPQHDGQTEIVNRFFGTMI
jgi:hypothetical protein